MKKIFTFFADNHMFATIFTVMLLLIGLNSLISIKKDLLPDVSYAIVSISCVYPKASPEDVEINVTNRIENALKDVEGIKEVSSLSIENISSVTVTLNDSLDERQIAQALQDLRDAIARIDDLPQGIEGAPVITRLKVGDRPVIIAGVSGKNKSYEELRYQAQLLERRLKRVGGISRVEMTGFLAREVRIELDPQKIKNYQLDINEMISAIQRRNIMGSAGAMESFACRQDIVMMSQFRRPGDVGDVIVRSTLDGPLVRVKDLATVKEGFEDETLIAKVNGEKVIALLLYKMESADIVRTVKAVRSSVTQAQENLPDGFSISLSNDYSRYVDASYRVVASNGIMGFILVVLILTLFLNFRVSIWVALGIPVSIFGTITVLQASGFSLNVISLSAMILVIGIIVDDAIIISESIFSEFESGKTPLDAAVNGVQKVFLPVISSLLTTVAAFFPLLLIPGSFGKFLFVMPLVVIVSLCVSLAEGVIALPAHVKQSIGKGAKLKERTFIRKLETKYVAVLSAILEHPLKTIAIAFFSLILIFSLSSKLLRFDSFPLEGAESMVINLETAQGCGGQVTSAAVEKIERILLTYPKTEIQSFITIIGKKDGSLPKQNYANISINLTPLSKRSRNAVQIAGELREKIADLGDIGKVVFDIRSAGPSAKKAISFKIVGNDDTERKKITDLLFAHLGTIDGVIEAERDDIEGKGQIAVEFDYERLARDGFDVADVLRELRVNYDGEIITSIQYADETVDYRLIASSTVDKNLNFLGNIYLTNKYGKVLQLNEIAKFSARTGLDGHRHYANERAVTIEANVKKPGPSVRDINTLLREKFNSAGAKNTWLLVQGEEENQNSSMASFGFTFLTALIGIYLLLSLQFKSFSMPLLVMLVIPFGVAGVQLAFIAHNWPLTFMGTMGIVGLTGVIVNDAIVMVDRLLQNDYSRMTAVKRIAAISEAARTRFRAVILTTLTTVAGVLPLAYGIGGQDFTNAPMALALGWGLLIGTVISLIILPTLFYCMITLRGGKPFKYKERKA